MHTRQVMDPCHANFTHHGVQGRRENEKGSQISVTSPVSPGGFQLQHSTANFTADITFQAPCFLKYNFGKFGRSMNVYVVPTKPGYCRMITKFMADDSAPPPPSAKGPMALVFKVRGVFQGSFSCTAQPCTVGGLGPPLVYKAKPGCVAAIQLERGLVAGCMQASVAACIQLSQQLGCRTDTHSVLAASQSTWPVVHIVMMCLLSWVLVLQMVGLLEGTAVLEHNLLRNKVLDGDNYIIHVQVCDGIRRDGRLAQAGGLLLLLRWQWLQAGLPRMGGMAFWGMLSICTRQSSLVSRSHTRSGASAFATLL
jgi:hypothetical protein